MAPIEPINDPHQARKWLTRILVVLLGCSTVLGCRVLLDRRTGFPSGAAAKVEITDCTIHPAGEFTFHLAYTTFISEARVQLIIEDSNGVRDISDLWEGGLPTSRLNDLVHCLQDAAGVRSGEFGSECSNSGELKPFVAINTELRLSRGDEILLYEEKEIGTWAKPGAEATTWRYILRVE
ncbi:MAG: hypothetical protein ABMA01_15480 [Chthoniobacteraceae bacterium]